MDNQMLFYYLCWLLFGLSFFFMQLSNSRRWILILILLIISSSPYFISIHILEISLPMIILVMVTQLLFGLSIFRKYEFIVAFLCMISYVALLMWEKTVPVLFFMPAKIIVSCIIVLLISFLIHVFSHKVMVVVIGLTFGQLIHEIILIVYELQQTIGELEDLNYLLTTILILIIYEWVKKGIITTIRYTKSLT